MKRKSTIYLLYLLLILLNSACATKKAIEQAKTAYSQNCQGVVGLSWMEHVQGADAETTAKLVTQITAAAEADAKKSADLQASGSVNVDFKSEVARVINQNVTQSTRVSEDFWQQEATFTQTLCLLVGLLDAKGLSKSKKHEIIDDLRTISVARANYSLNKKKIMPQ